MCECASRIDADAMPSIGVQEATSQDGGDERVFGPVVQDPVIPTLLNQGGAQGRSLVRKHDRAKFTFDLLAGVPRDEILVSGGSSRVAFYASTAEYVLHLLAEGVVGLAALQMILVTNLGQQIQGPLRRRRRPRFD
eukprot:CAMPEP_0183409396 /NCGR_PEP_ID=MMETSP0370-20130417/18795_1 /TAXON_ID=268820 /ORGANISM="Peridinium aciculiferum, Strain PAER-2" /LENGTH=135 /DNA_ID=CAMNT_0025592073 /DNA_START=258 /DNA_END=665 /DNA_ORIENTATION=-